MGDGVISTSLPSKKGESASSLTFFLFISSAYSSHRSLATGLRGGLTLPTWTMWCSSTSPGTQVSTSAASGGPPGAPAAGARPLCLWWASRSPWPVESWTGTRRATLSTIFPPARGELQAVSSWPYIFEPIFLWGHQGGEVPSLPALPAVHSRRWELPSPNYLISKRKDQKRVLAWLISPFHPSPHLFRVQTVDPRKGGSEACFMGFILWHPWTRHSIGPNLNSCKMYEKRGILAWFSFWQVGHFLCNQGWLQLGIWNRDEQVDRLWHVGTHPPWDSSAAILVRPIWMHARPTNKSWLPEVKDA